MLKSSVAFVMMGLFVGGAIIFAFVILPKMDRSAFGSTGLSLDFPLKDKEVKSISREFCKDGSTHLYIEVEEGSKIFSVVDGTVIVAKDGKVKIEVKNNLFLEYDNLINIPVREGDYILKGNVIGKVQGNSLKFGIRDEKDSLYICPYLYMNNENRCLCNSVKF